MLKPRFIIVCLAQFVSVVAEVWNINPRRLLSARAGVKRLEIAVGAIDNVCRGTYLLTNFPWFFLGEVLIFFLLLESVTIVLVSSLVRDLDLRAEIYIGI